MKLREVAGLFVAFSAWAACPSVGIADIIIVSGNGTPNNTTGLSATGPTSAQGVDLSPPNDPLYTITTDQGLAISGNNPAQARIDAVGTNFTTFTILPTVGFGFTGLELNPMIDPGSGTMGTFLVEAFDQFGGSETETFDLGPGENRFFALAFNGQLITELNVTANGPFIDSIRQIRTQGFSDLNNPPDIATPVPEPGSLAILGIAGMGALVVARRRKRAIAAD